MSRKNIAIEDVSGYFGQLLLPLLEDDPEVKLVIGIDRHPPPSSNNWNKLSFHQLDIRDPSLGEVLANAMHIPPGVYAVETSRPFLLRSVSERDDRKH